MLLTLAQAREVVDCDDAAVPRLHQMSLEVSRTIANVCQRCLGVTLVEEQVTDHGRGIVLSQRPLVHIQQISINQTLCFDYVVQDIHDGWLTTPRGHSGHGWTDQLPPYPLEVWVRYTGGYVLPTTHDPGTLPAPITQAALALLTAWWDMPADQETIAPHILGLLSPWIDRKDVP